MPELIIKTLTPLEFLNEESLLKDILDKVNNTADLSKTVFDDSNILLELPDSAVERYVVRRQHSSRAYEVKKELPAQTLLSLPPSSELIVMYTVDEAENEGTAICIRNFIKSLNKGKSVRTLLRTYLNLRMHWKKMALKMNTRIPAQRT